MIYRFHSLLKIICLGLAIIMPVNSFADSGGKKGADDCVDNSVNYADDESLTHQEKIAAMDRALNNSLNRYDSCVTSVNSSSAASSNSSGGATSSSAASDVSGTEATSPANTVTAGNTEASGSADTASASRPPQSNGKLPEDIPKADNDSVLQAQIRQAAINETDPAKKERLWDEYRKYKGLPLKQH
ncbi:hypothetical protein A9Q83_16580 [Alphaproteobacteria bacterium 46_93_T64]|nr:hypothetical protein A9Q83_16580 [Alphaproteobacteria bacterium 46_93_T64]